jgi:hypothetical protein
MLPAIVIAIVLMMVGMDIAVIGAFIRLSWQPLEKRYPETSLKSPSVRKNFQTFAIGMVNFGWCVHVELDDDHLHMIPARFLKWFGCRTISIPWQAVQAGLEFDRHPRRFTRKMKLGSQTIAGPKWCLDAASRLAEP